MLGNIPDNMPGRVRIISWDDFISGRESITERVSITIGVFDGVHTGHQRLIREITRDQDSLPCVITFIRNPAAVLARGTFPGNISSLEQKLAKLEIFGIRLAILIDFSLDFSKIDGKEFINLVSGRCGIDKVAVGANFQFGHKKKNSVKELQSVFSGIPVEIAAPVTFNGKIVSSTLIRKLISVGNLDEAAAMLGNAYELDIQGLVPDITQDGHCRVLKSSVQLTERLIPGDGVYSAATITGRGRIPAEIVIQHDEIIWEKQKDSDYSDMKSILFISKRS